MKKKIYLAVTVLLLTLAGIYVAARMILWGGPVSFRSYVLLLGDLDSDPEWEITADSDEQVYFDITYQFLKYERKKA